MFFLAWYYTKGIALYLKRWFYILASINHYFSTFLLIETLFAPWRRLNIVDRRPGFDISRFFTDLTFNLISRGTGAVVRFTLFWVSLFLLITCLILGALGLPFWLLLPPLGLPSYFRYKKRPEIYLKKINSIETLLSGEMGKFLLTHTGLTMDDLISTADLKKVDTSLFKAESLENLMTNLIKNNVWEEESLRTKNLNGEDLIRAAYWWDERCRNLSGINLEEFYRRPGIGLELLFGYTPTLDRYAVDMAAPQEFSGHLVGRLATVSKMANEMTGGNNVILIGQPGVGKRTIVLEFAHRAASGKLGQKMSYKRVTEFDYNSLLSETVDLNLKKTKLSDVFEEASAAGNIILVIRDIQRLTNAIVEGFDFTDILESHLERGKLKIIAISTPTDYERFISPNLRLMKFFTKVEAKAPDYEQAGQILIETADEIETKKGILLTTPVIRKILEGSDRYITDTPFPEKALELMDALIIYKEENSGGAILPKDVDAILSEKTGISFNDITHERKVQLTNLEAVIHERLINQKPAVDLIAKSLRAKTLDIGGQKKPLGSFLFMGPTGVGKTQTAKVLSNVYFGSEASMLRFNMNEYSEREGLERLIGSAVRREPGNLTTEIKNHPASLLLLDEIEKAPREVLNLFLGLLDEGEITDAMGRKILCRNLFVVATSNAGTENIRQLLEKGVDPADLQKLTLDYVLKERIFSPEFINRFDGVVVYTPLSEDNLKLVAKLKLTELVNNLKKKNIYLEVTDELVDKVAKDGYSAEFGARPMERVINLTIGDVISRAFLKDELASGDRITLIPEGGLNEYKIQKSTP